MKFLPDVAEEILVHAYKGGRCKQGAIIFHRGRVVVNFVPKFVAMATGVSREKFLTTPSDSPGPKIVSRCEQRAIIFLREMSYPL